jgi:hypothetical protein
VLATFYIGIAAEALAFATQDRLRLAGRALLVVTALLALHWCIAINAALLRDPRYDAEAWLQVHVKPGDVIETYGQNCFLPRFPRGAMVTRIGQGDPRLRNPLPGVTERQQPFIAPRQSRFIVVSLAWARRYLRAAMPLGAGRIYSPLQQVDFANGDAHMYFTALAAGKLNYRLAYAASYHGIWPVVHIHDSLDEAIWIFERDR